MRNSDLLDVCFHPDFTRDALCHSDTAVRCGLDNRCEGEHLANLARLSGFLGQICQRLNVAPADLTINSGYRNEALNALVGGVPESQHCLGLAVDLRCPSMGTAYALATAIAAAPELEFDQLILEFNRWVHVSVPPAGQTARREVLSIFSSDEGYLEGLILR
ncbi:MAG: D-Ala-D-Ala carboxypeptidase family metallohydrolase [Limnobacter sp.]|uniref:D-Ala-D-Ala carboxypeptidase family metallohydrolase n=1 Tax=Limnobacter sp. TaxID=2003368 RepID=UPI00391D0F77